MDEECGIEYTSFHEMGLDDRILKVCTVPDAAMLCVFKSYLASVGTARHS